MIAHMPKSSEFYVCMYAWGVFYVEETARSLLKNYFHAIYAEQKKNSTLLAFSAASRIRSRPATKYGVCQTIGKEPSFSLMSNQIRY